MIRIEQGMKLTGLAPLNAQVLQIVLKRAWEEQVNTK